MENRFAQRPPSHKASARQADYVIEGYVDATEPLRLSACGTHGQTTKARSATVAKCEV